MAGDHTNHENTGSGGMNLQAAVAEIRRLQAKVTAIEAEKMNKATGQEEDEEITESQPLSQVLWDTRVPEGFKTPHLPTFDGKTDPLEHLMVVGT
ncbi:hypothetical protein A2U01_0058877, partial [Trifolium medium]|nr:hypothetical protein [Trifolium medium]